MKTPDRLMSVEPSEPELEVLDSWKGIAAWFGVTVRTAQLWERDNGLPIRRQPGLRGRVYAYAHELRAWRERPLSKLPVPAIPAAPNSNFRSRFIIFAAAMLIAVGLLAYTRDDSRSPATTRLDGPVLIVSDQHGAELWRHRFPTVPAPEPGSGGKPIRSLIADLDADGRPELLYPYQHSGSSNSDELHCFSSSGQPLWTFRLGRPVSTPERSFPSLYRYSFLKLLPAGPEGPPRVLVSAHQVPDYPAQLALLDARGRLLHEYWHSGHLSLAATADLDADGKPELYLAGIANGSITSDLIALDPDGFGGASREENPRYQILNMPPPRERARILFPRSRLSHLLDHYSVPDVLLASGASLSIHISDIYDAQHGISTAYTFTSGLRLARVEQGDGTPLEYNYLRSRGILPPSFVPDSLESLSAIQFLTPFSPGTKQLARN